MDLKNARVLITGGSSGIGFETAKELIEAGAKVAITGRDKSKLEKAAKEIGAVPLHYDSSNEKEVVKLVEETIKHLGDYNVLINNAAYGYFKPLAEINLDEFNKMFATNVTGSMLAARESAKYFIKKEYGNIINISSTAGLSGFANGTAYVASKFALKGMTECWRQELRKYNIRVMLVNPSEVQTNFSKNAGGTNRDYNLSKLQSSEIAHAILSMLKLEDRGFITEATVWATNPK